MSSTLLACQAKQMHSFQQPYKSVQEEDQWKPEGGYVPDEETAIKIAVAVWIPIYGKEHIERKAPFKAVLKDCTWYVKGSLPQGWKGGVPEAQISKDDGRILKVEHGM